jgi:hypothetical protein
MSATEIVPGADDGGEANNGNDGDGTPPLAAAAEGGATLDISESSEGEAASDEDDDATASYDEDDDEVLEQPAPDSAARMSATTEEDLSDGEADARVAAVAGACAARGGGGASLAPSAAAVGGAAGAAASTPATAASPPPPPPVVIKVRTVDEKGRETWFQLKETTRLGKLIDTYCQREGGGKDTGVLNFLFDPTGQGREPHARGVGLGQFVCLARSDTPRSLGMREGDRIVVAANRFIGFAETRFHLVGSTPRGLNAKKLGTYVLRPEVVNSRPTYGLFRHSTEEFDARVWWAAGEWRVGAAKNLGTLSRFLRMRCDLGDAPYNTPRGWQVWDDLSGAAGKWVEAPSLRCYDDLGVEGELQTVPRVVHLVGSTRDGIQQRRLGVYEQQESARRAASAASAPSKSRRPHGLLGGLIRPMFLKRGDPSTAMWHHAGRWTVGKSVDVGKDMGGVKGEQADRIHRPNPPTESTDRIHRPTARPRARALRPALVWFGGGRGGALRD